MKTVEGSFLAKAMELCNSMMQFTGCELYSHNTRGLLKGLKSAINTLDSDGDEVTDEKIGCVKLLIDALLEEEGIAEAEMLASCDPDPDLDWDDCPFCGEDYYEDEECCGPDPMYSVEAAFAYIEEQEYLKSQSDADAADCDDYYEEEARRQEDEEMEDWVSTPHEGINTGLKQIDEEIEDCKIAAAIWRAREKVMDKIIFSNGDEYPIHRINMELDDEYHPVDIIISSRKMYLDEIAEKHCQLGYTCGDEAVNGFFEALYGRLDRFAIKDWEGNIHLY